MTVTALSCGPPARSVGLGAPGVVLLQPAQHAVAAVGQGPVQVLVDDQGQGVNAIVGLLDGAGLGGSQVGPVTAMRESGGCPPSGAHLPGGQAFNEAVAALCVQASDGVGDLYALALSLTAGDTERPGLLDYIKGLRFIRAVRDALRREVRRNLWPRTSPKPRDPAAVGPFPGFRGGARPYHRRE